MMASNRVSGTHACGKDIGMRNEQIGREYLRSIVTKRGDYDYFINPIADGIPLVTKELMDEIAANAEEMIDVDFDYVLAPEALAIPMATAFTMRTGKPFMVIRKRRYGIPDEIAVEKSTGYEKSVSAYINFVKPGDKVVLFDDVVSTGGTMEAIADALREHCVKVVMAVVVLNKSKDLPALSERLGFLVKAMLDVSVKDGRPCIG